MWYDFAQGNQKLAYTLIFASIPDCGIGQFKCAMGGGCISLEFVCDGIEQCADHSDEWNCIKIDTLENPGNDTEVTKNITYLLVIILFIYF